MKAPRGRILAVLMGSVGLAVLAGAAFASRDIILTSWYAHRLRSENIDEQMAAIHSLGRLRTSRAARVLAAYFGDARNPLKPEVSQELMDMGEVAMEPLVEVFPLVDDFDGGGYTMAERPQHDYAGIGELLSALLELQREDPNVKLLLGNIGSERDDSKDIVPPGKYKFLKWKSGVQPIEGTPCRIFLFGPSYGPWPGAQTILVTDVGGRVITWKEVGGEPFFLTCELETVNDGAVSLVITCEERRRSTPGKYTYRLTLRGIEEERRHMTAVLLAAMPGRGTR
jgi:hypothetical protein